MRDTNLIFNSNVTISGTSMSAILDMSKWSDKGVWVQIVHTGVVGGAPNTGAQLNAWLEYSNNATFVGATVDSARPQGPDLVREQNTAGFRVSRLCQSNLRYARVQYSVLGSSPSFTGIYAHVVSGPQRDDTAGVNTV